MGMTAQVEELTKQVALIGKKQDDDNDLKYKDEIAELKRQLAAAKESAGTNLGAIGVEGHRMTGNDFMLSALDDTGDKQHQIHKSPWFEGKVIDIGNQDDDDSSDYPKRTGMRSETVLKAGEYLALPQYLVMFLTFVTTCMYALSTTTASLFNYVFTAGEAKIIRVGFVGIFTALVFAFFILGTQASPGGKWTSPLVNARSASARRRHDIYCFQASAGMVHNKLFLDSGASRTIIHDASMLKNVRPLAQVRTIQGLTGDQNIKYKADLQLHMVNTTGKNCTVVIKDVYYNPALQYNLVSVSDMAEHDYTSTFSYQHAGTNRNI